MTKFLWSAALFCAATLAIPTVFAEETAWTDRITLKGDVRLRYEGIDADDVSDRNRTRFRARFGLTAEVYDDVKFVFQLASGGDNPVSTNQSFDGGFSTKDIGIDLAFVEWAANDNVTVFAGKMKNPLYRAGGVPLIWDGDLNPEGIAAHYKAGKLFAAAGLFSAEERSVADDSLMYAAQAGMNFDVGSSSKLTAGVGYFAYTNTIGNLPFYDFQPSGNSVDAANRYLYDYRNTELFAQYDARLRNWPLRVYAHVTQNSEVSQQDTAYAFGAKIGSAKGQGSSEYSWTYQDIEADAVIATFNDSDFAGGGTDSSGHIVKAKYMLRDKISLGGTLFINETDRFQGTEFDYRRIQLDVEFKFN